MKYFQRYHDVVGIAVLVKITWFFFNICPKFLKKSFILKISPFLSESTNSQAQNLFQSSGYGWLYGTLRLNQLGRLTCCNFCPLAFVVHQPIFQLQLLLVHGSFIVGPIETMVQNLFTLPTSVVWTKEESVWIGWGTNVLMSMDCFSTVDEGTVINNMVLMIKMLQFQHPTIWLKP